MTSPDESRAEAALSVLRGASVAEVAGAHGVGPEVVLRWVDLFCEGGEARLTDEAPLAPSTRDRFLTLIAHEFRTPLAIISGWVDLMMGTSPAADVRSEALSSIKRQVAHLERVARDALDAGALARGQLRLMVAPLGLRALVGAVLRSVSDPNVVLLPGPEVEVVADASRLEQVVGGVVEHARRLADGTPVEVEVLTDGAEQVMVKASVKGRALEIADAAALLEPYARADTSFGTGLGLYLSRAILAAHGGEIGLRAEGPTTTFWFRLPCSGPQMGKLVQRS